MDRSAVTVEAWLVFFLIQAVPSGAALIRLSRTPAAGPFPREGRVFAFDSFVFLSLWLLLLLDLFVIWISPRGAWVLLATGVAAVYALILSAEFSSHAAVSGFAARIFSPAPSGAWLAASLAIFPALLAIGYGLNVLLPAFPRAALLFHTFPGGRPLGRIILLFLSNALFGGGIGGEPFWRGVLYARLRERRPFFRAAYAAGTAQAIWYIPCGLLIGLGLRGALVLSALVLSASPAFAWVYERSRRSLLAVIIMFSSMTTALDLIPLTFTTVLILTFIVPAAVHIEKKIRRSLEP
jgi:membrane protease YdiL (CAAX protease family)